MLLQTLVAFAAVGLLGLILKLFFGHGRDVPTVVWPTTDPEDFGLLTPVAVVGSAEEAAAFKTLLANAGIKATTNQGVDGRYRVLVFASELDRARRVTGTP
jgi:hypothetical protein